MTKWKRCDVCGRVTNTRDGEVKPLEVCRDVERNQDLCFWCYQAPLKPTIERKERAE